MAILLAIRAVCFLFVTSHGAWGTAEVQRILIPKNDSHAPIPCVGLQPNERPSLLFWFIGETWEIAKDSLVFRYSGPNVGQNLTVNDRYSISHGFGLVIGKLDTTDSGRYWCRVVRAEGEESIEAVDITIVVGDLLQGPVVWWEPSGSPISKVNVMKQQILNCSVNNVFPNPDLTWSFLGCRNTANRSMELFTSNQQSSYDVFSKTYHVTKRAYFGALDVKTDDNCTFECVAKGVAIRNRSSSTVVEIFATAQQPESKSSGTTLAFIFLAVILIVCVIALVYFMYRVWRLPQRRIVKYTQHKPKVKLEEETELCQGQQKEQEAVKRVDITADGTTHWSSRHSLGDYGILFSKDEQPGDTQEVIGDSQGLLLALPKAVIRYRNTPKAKPEIFTGEKFPGDVTSIVLHPDSETLIVGLRKIKDKTTKKNEASLIFFDMNSGNKEHSVELKNFTFPKVTVDGAGAIFVGDLDGRILQIFERYSKTPGVKYKLDIAKLKNIAAYGWKHLFVVNENCTIIKYIFKRTGACLDMSKIKDCIQITLAEGKVLGEIVVHNNRLYVVNGTRIHAYDVEVFELLHTFETDFQNLQGLCFFGLSGVALYSTKCVQTYEIEKKKKRKEEGNSSETV